MPFFAAVGTTTWLLIPSDTTPLMMATEKGKVDVRSCACAETGRTGRLLDVLNAALFALSRLCGLQIVALLLDSGADVTRRNAVRSLPYLDIRGYPVPN